jgi:hypothetical protein
MLDKDKIMIIGEPGVGSSINPGVLGKAINEYLGSGQSSMGDLIITPQFKPEPTELKITREFDFDVIPINYFDDNPFNQHKHDQTCAKNRKKRKKKKRAKRK